MEFKQVSLKLNKDPDSSMPLVYGGFEKATMKNIDFGKGAKGKENKDKFRELQGHIKKSIKDYNRTVYSRGDGGRLSLNGTDGEINLLVSSNIPQTFKFLGMDITEDLEIVVKSNNGCVLFARPGGFMFEQCLKVDTYDDIIYSYLPDNSSLGRQPSGEELSNLYKNISARDLMNLIEDLRVDYFKNNGYGLHHTYGSGDRLDGKSDDILVMFPSIDEISDNLFLVGGVGKNKSIILNYLSSETSDPVMLARYLKPNELKRLVACVFLSCMENLSSCYRSFCSVVSVADKYLNLYGSIFGQDKLHRYISDCSQDNDDEDIPALLDGISGLGQGKNLINVDEYDNTNGREFVTKLKRVFGGSGRVAFDNNLVGTLKSVMGSPDEIKNSTDYNTVMSYSALDLLRYKDEDMDITFEAYNEDDVDNIIPNIAKAMNTKMKGFHDDPNADFESDLISFMTYDEVNDVIDYEGSSVLNNLRNNNSSADGVITIKGRSAVDKRAMMKSGKLIQKALKRIMKEFERKG